MSAECNEYGQQDLDGAKGFGEPIQHLPDLFCPE